MLISPTTCLVHLYGHNTLDVKTRSGSFFKSNINFVNLATPTLNFGAKLSFVSCSFNLILDIYKDDFEPSSPLNPAHNLDLLCSSPANLYILA